VKFALFEAGAEPGSRGPVVVQRAQVRPFGHEHHAGEAELGRFVDELVDGQKVLTPGTGVADRVQNRGSQHDVLFYCKDLPD